MIRAQIYITTLERQKLFKLSKKMGKSQSQLIREAIDHFIEAHTNLQKNKLAILRAAKGLWSNRKDLPDFTHLRKEFDRHNQTRDGGLSDN